MIATQDYGWSQLAVQAGLTWPDATPWAMSHAAEAGFDGWEPFVATAADLHRIAALAAAHGLRLPSLFVSGPLHTPAATETVTRVLHIATEAARHGSRHVMIYPAPADKTDADLTRQARALDQLGAALAAMGLTLCYHPEEPDLRHAAREVHHMLLATDPAHLALCLDPDTIWRGAGRSNLSVLDLIHLYRPRIRALHIRQSQRGIWAETVAAGDIDYPAIAAAMTGTTPLIVVEHAYEAATPATLDPVTAHRRSLDYVRATFT